MTGRRKPTSSPGFLSSSPPAATAAGRWRRRGRVRVVLLVGVSVLAACKCILAAVPGGRNGKDGPWGGGEVENDHVRLWPENDHVPSKYLNSG